MKAGKAIALSPTHHNRAHAYDGHENPQGGQLFMNRFTIGSIKVTRIQEWQGGFSAPEYLFPSCTAEDWSSLEEEFTPEYFDAQSGKLYAFLQSWVLDTGEYRILFDTGAGNDKPRPNLPIFSNLKTDFLLNLAKAGYQPEDIDYVVCSHVHVDHVGWNTRLIDGKWEATFRNAQYLLPLADRDYWNPQVTEIGPGEIGRLVNDGMFEDSVRPLMNSGRLVWTEDGHEILPGITLRTFPGHTPGSTVMYVHSGNMKAMFVGDLMHHPAQIYHPYWNSQFCEDQEMAILSRLRMLKQAASTDAVVIPAHFGGEHIVKIASEGSGFRPIYLKSATGQGGFSA